MGAEHRYTEELETIFVSNEKFLTLHK